MFAAKCLFLFLVHSTPVKSNQNCEHAELDINPLLIDDCDLVNDKLQVNTNWFTPYQHSQCVSKVHLSAYDHQFSFDIYVDGKISVEFSNPLNGAERCVSVQFGVTVTFLSG